MKAGADLNPKLTRRLKLALLITLLAVLILATIAAAVTAYLEASDIQDETLLSVAQLVESNQMDASSDYDRSDDHDRDERDNDDHDSDDSAVQVWEVGQRKRHRLSFKKSLKSGFHTVREDDDFWRVYVTRENRIGKRYYVAQKLSVSAELALNSAKNTALPLLVLFLLVPLLVTLVVRHSFKPLNDLTEKVAGSDSLKLDLADKNEIPVEVMPFVSAIDQLLENNAAYNQRQRRFIADAAHELRTPITALSLEIQNLQSAPNEQVKVQRQEALSQSVSRLQRLVKQLLDLARAQSSIAENNVLTDLNKLVREQISDLYPLVEEKRIEMSVARNEPVKLIDNNNQLQHLIRNALSNAIKFAPEAGTIEVEIYINGTQAVFTVTDNGAGADPEQLEKLHQPFYRPEGQASGQGAGLGLAICHEIAANLKGRIQLQNVAPTGFKFCYTQALAP